MGQALALVATFTITGLIHEGCLESQQTYYFDQQLHRESGHRYLHGASRETLREFGFGAKGFATTYAFVVQALFLMLEKLWLETLEPQFVQWKTATPSKEKIVKGKLRSLIGWLWTLSCMTYSGLYIVDVSCCPRLS